MTSGLTFGSMFSKANDDGSKKKMYYYSVPPSAFVPYEPAVDSVLVTTSAIEILGATDFIVAPVNLPHGAVVMRAKVFGTSDLNNNVMNVREESLGSLVPNAICTGFVNAWVIANQDYADVENDKYHYSVMIDSPDIGSECYGVCIEYMI